MYMRFFEDMTQARIAEHFGVSQLHVSRIISRGCARIRDRVPAPLPAPRRHGDTRGD
ncbi:RNA polymerase sigma-B factor [Streptomyces sp. 1222.5]|nr:RNA polymerase sigma-B factor [Streptomyces sp. 1222.5]